MAISEESNSEARESMMKIVNKDDKKVYLVAQDLKLVRVLAGNNKTARDKALNTLKRWFIERSKTVPLTEDDFQRIWKGLFYSMWMSDKPLVQEECAENIANLIHFPMLNDSLLFFKAGITILCNEWFGIDQLRLDKFLMFVRRLLRRMFVVLKQHGLNKKNIEDFSNILSETILNPNAEPPISLFMHFTEIFLEELAKVTNGNINVDHSLDMIQPFIKKLAVTNDGRQIGHIRKFIFTYLIRQSNLGLEYQAKYEAWKKAGFQGSINSVQKIKLNRDENVSSKEQSNKSAVKERPLDPRAGRVDVELPQIKFNPRAVATALLQHKFDKNSNPKSRKLISALAVQFSNLGKGIYPLGAKKILDDEKNVYDTGIRKAANRLIKFEKKLMGKDRKRKRNRINNETKSEVKEKRRKIENEKVEDNSNATNSNIEDDDKPKLEEKRIKIDKNTAKSKKAKSNRKVKNGKIGNENIKLEVKVNDSSIEKNKAEDKKDNNNRNVDSDKIDNNELKRFIKRSEKNINKQLKHNFNHNKIEKKNKKKNLNSTENIIDNIECVFERNSGTWVVYDVSREKEEGETPFLQTGSLNESVGNSSEIKITPSKLSESSKELLDSTKTKKRANKVPGSNTETVRSLSKSANNRTKSKESPRKGTTHEENGSPQSGLYPVKLFESPQKKKEIFPKSEWDEPLQEGEYEICIPSKKYMGKLKALAKKKRHSVHELVNTSVKIKGKSRLSLDSSLVKNPFSTPSSMKKVKINVKLNMSQEVHEHHAQIKNSPGIPYDANKKPSKPLLKTPVSSTPINPFYNKQLSVW